jgi:hypothetical protein
VVLEISRRQIDMQDVSSVLAELRVFSASREDAWMYRNQIVLTIDGYNDDPRELVNIPEVRSFLSDLLDRWPPWAFFINQVDNSIKLLVMCCCGISFPKNGSAEIGQDKLMIFLLSAFEGINQMFNRHAFDEAERSVMCDGFIECIEQSA